MGADSDYIEPSKADFMFNLVVDDLDAALAMTNIKPGEMLILYPRLVAATFADGSRGEMTPTLRQLLHGRRYDL